VQLVYGETWQEPISEDALAKHSRPPITNDRLAAVAKLYIDGIHNLKERQAATQVVVLPISDETWKMQFVSRTSAAAFSPRKTARAAVKREVGFRRTIGSTTTWGRGCRSLRLMDAIDIELCNGCEPSW